MKWWRAPAAHPGRRRRISAEGDGHEGHGALGQRGAERGKNGAGGGLVYPQFVAELFDSVDEEFTREINRGGGPEKQYSCEHERQKYTIGLVMNDLQHRDVTANGIRIHFAEQGTGPLVLLCHGFPEGWYSWRDQLPALAAAGYHAVASDMPEHLPAWFTDADLDHMAAEFSHSGFRGGLNWYRNIDRNWELTAPWAGALIRQPALFIAGSEDPVIALGSGAAAVQALPDTVPGLTRQLLIDGAGHFIQQERPRLVNEALAGFLDALSPWGR